MTVVDGGDLDAELADQLGSGARSLLGVGISRASKQYDSTAADTRSRQHRVLALLATLKIIDIAHSAGMPNVLVLEGDVRPLSKFSLSAEDVSQLAVYLRENPWEVLRPSGYFQDFAYHSRHRAASCPRQCTGYTTKLAGGSG